MYVVATPIGNLDDISIRALKILSSVDVVAAEDTRKTKQLLSHFSITTPLISCHEHNEAEKALELIHQMKNGASVAIVSDAGTPTVSDPGFRLVKSSIKEGIVVVPIPGVSAAITALCVSGIPTDSFVFVGFLQRKKSRRHEQLKAMATEKRSIVLYESPKRLVSLLGELREFFGDRYAVVGREMTKLHEEFLRGTFSNLMDALSAKDVIKGECCLILSGAGEMQVDRETLDLDIEKHLESSALKPAVLARHLSEKYSMKRNEVYERILKIKNERSS